jgi:single-strand DNA-binding protein
VNESFKNQAGELVERTCFVDVVVWGRQAETAAEYLHKGSSVFVEGRLQLDQWENQQGEKRSKLRVRADRIQFLGGGGSAKESESVVAPTASSAPPSPAVPPTPDVATDDDEDVPF